MRIQYEKELQALRKEFNIRQSEERDQQLTKEAKDNKQSETQLINQ